MAGLQLADAIGHGLNTYAQLQGIQNNKDRSLREAQSFEMDKQAFDMQKQDRAEQSKINNVRMRQLEQAELDKVNHLNARKMRVMAGAGVEWSPENQKALENYGRTADPEYLLAPETGAALETFEKVMSGEIDKNDPRAIQSANRLINVQRGATEGRQVQINRIYPSKDGQGIHLGLHVKNADGTENPKGVLTDRRSSDPDDIVSTISFDELISNYSNIKQARSALSDPKMRQAFMDYYDPLPDQSVSAKDQSTIQKNTALSKLYESRAETEKVNREKIIKEVKSGGGSGGKLPADAQMIEFYRGMGYSDEDSIAMVKEAVSSPAQFVTAYSKMLFDSSKDYNGKATITPEEATKISMDIYNANFRKSPKKPDPKPESKPASTESKPQQATPSISNW